MLMALAMIFSVNGYVGLKNAEDLYARSLIARDYPALKFSYKRLSVILELIGRTEKAKEFQEKCYENVDTIAVDGKSEENDLATAGSIKSECMNLMVSLNLETGDPVSAKVFPGYTVDRSVFIDFISSCGTVRNKLILANMGFFSAENTDYIDRNGGHYIVPVSENRKVYGECTTHVLQL